MSTVTSRRKARRKAAPIGLKKGAVMAIHEAIFWHTALIVTDSGTGCGTATAIRWKTHNLLVTANHVVRTTTDSNLGFIFRPTGTLEQEVWWERPSVDKINPNPASPIPILRRFSDLTNDLAALEVSPALLQERPVKFFEIRKEMRLPNRLPSSIATIGFPADSVEQLNPGAHALQAFATWGNRKRPGRTLPPGYIKGRHFLVEFAGAQDGKNPKGLSGAGAWYCEAIPESKVWFPNLGLAGICTTYYPQRQAIRVCRIEKLVSFLQRVPP